MTFKDLQENNIVYAYLNGQLLRKYEFKKWLNDNKMQLFDLEKLNDVILTINNRNQPFSSIQTSRGLVKLSVREWK